MSRNRELAFTYHTDVMFDSSKSDSETPPSAHRPRAVTPARALNLPVESRLGDNDSALIVGIELFAGAVSH